MDKKWNIQKQNRKKGYLKIHITIDIKSKKILSIEVTATEHKHDSKMLPKLVEDILSINGGSMIDKILTDGSYDSKIFLDTYQRKVEYLALRCESIQG